MFNKFLNWLDKHPDSFITKYLDSIVGDDKIYRVKKFYCNFYRRFSLGWTDKLSIFVGKPELFCVNSSCVTTPFWNLFNICWHHSVLGDGLFVDGQDVTEEFYKVLDYEFMKK